MGKMKKLIISTKYFFDRTINFFKRMIVFVILLNLQNHSIYSPPIVFVLVGHSFLTLLAILPEAAEPEGQSTLCGRHGPDKNLRLGLLIMNYETFLCVQSESMLKTIPAGYSLLVIFQIYFFNTIKSDQKTINFVYFCSNS